MGSACPGLTTTGKQLQQTCTPCSTSAAPRMYPKQRGGRGCRPGRSKITFYLHMPHGADCACPEQTHSAGPPMHSGLRGGLCAAWASRERLCKPALRALTRKHQIQPQIWVCCGRQPSMCLAGERPTPPHQAPRSATYPRHPTKLPIQARKHASTPAPARRIIRCLLPTTSLCCKAASAPVAAAMKAHTIA